MKKQQNHKNIKRINARRREVSWTAIRHRRCSQARSRNPHHRDAVNDRRLDYPHKTVNHAEEYVSGNVYTNGIENFWAQLKRGLHGTYISVQPFHLFRYLDERMFTFNNRNLTDLGRFTMALGSVTDRRLTYTELTGKA